MLLKGKKVLVTGASGGIGKCLVSTFAKEGADIAIHFHTNKKCAGELSEQFKEKSFVVCGDLSQESDTRRVFDEVYKIFGKSP